MMISRCLALMIEPAVLTKATPASSSGKLMLDPGLVNDVPLAAAFFGALGVEVSLRLGLSLIDFP